MQKLMNVIVIFSGLVSLSVVGVSAYVYLNKDTMIENAKKGVTKAATEAITQALPGLIDSAMPELPNVTGGIVNESTPLNGVAVPF